MRFLILFIFTSIIAKSQDIDTLLPHILALENDTEKVNQLYKNGFALRNSDPQLSFRFAKFCEQSALRTHSKKHLAKSYNLLGVLFYKKGDFKKAISYHKKALLLRRDCNDVLGIAFSETNLGNIYTDIKSFSEAEECYLQAMQAYNQLNNKEQTANTLMNLGILKFNLKQYDAAIENYAVALRIGEELNNYEIKSNCLENIGQAYGIKADFNRAIAYNEDALKLRHLMENGRDVAASYLNLSLYYMYEETKDLKKAKKYIDTAFSIGNAYEDFDIKKIASKSYALYYNEIKDFEKAFKWFQKFDHLKDSLLLFQNTNVTDYNFDEQMETALTESKQQTLMNKPLLSIILLLLIVIPFTLIRFKR